MPLLISIGPTLSVYGQVSNVVEDASATFTIRTSGAVGTPRISLSSSTLPGEWVFVDNLDGTATLSVVSASVLGDYTFRVRAVDNLRFPVFADFTLSVFRQFAVVTPLSLTGDYPDATFGQAYSETLTLSGGAAPYTPSVVSGSLPAGLALSMNGSDDVLLSGTPDDTFRLVGDFPNGVENQYYDHAMSVVYSLDVVPPLTFSISSGALPPGWSLNPYTGRISGDTGLGSPAVVGSPNVFTFTLTASDSSSPTLVASSAQVVEIETSGRTGPIADWFAAGGLGVWYPIDPDNCYTDTAGLTKATVGDPVARVNDLGPGGFHLEQATSANRPTLRWDAGLSRYYLEFVAANTQSLSTAAYSAHADWTWFHDGTEWLFVSRVQFGTVANPTAFYYLAATHAGASAGRGSAILYDDSSLSDTIRLDIYRAVSGNATLLARLPNFTPNTVTVLSATYGYAISGNDGNIYRNGSNSGLTGGESLNAPSSGNPTGRLSVGIATGGSSPLQGRIYELVIARGAGAIAKRSDFESDV